MIADNVKRVREQIAEAAISVGRDPSEITLVAASKTQNYDAVREAILAGVDACGENQVQEMVRKHSEGAYAGVPLHFIGHLQSNKVKQVVGVADVIQSVDSRSLAELISKQAEKLGIVQKILLEVNIGGEESKSGFSPEQTSEAIDYVNQLSGVKIVGLMTIPPNMGVESKKNEYFSKMLKIYVDNCGKMLHNKVDKFLSMGMSGDFTEAIKSGANMVRVGTAIFGSRVYNK
ncbi:MAG: YggS family pyridoxal phosphate-dependent enzyme [Oscillospiraceae bacterium]|jgi:pyridoxal phosphate enzyme (YggS family)|nr:YggS family pyridoxal phosphate-dependent enzyme [Oscillospiraceae bacterium]